MPVQPGRGPLYRQVRERLVSRIADGHWQPGQPLPSEITLAGEFGVSQGTVRKALDALAAENLVVRHQGKGTFVATHTAQRELFHFFHLVGPDGAKRMPLTRWLLSCRQRRAERDETVRLRLTGNAHVVEIKRLRDMGGTPAILETIVVPANLFPGLSETATLPNELYQLYEEGYGVTIHKALETLRAVAADRDAARLLGVQIGAPLLCVDRLAETLDGTPVELRVSLCDTRDYTYLSEIV
jgi:GntR family transcriptional regulator